MAIKSFISRETELQVLVSYISRISEVEQRRIVFITSEAGVGKSELIGQIREKVFKKCSDIRLATAYCNELSGGGHPYQPFFDIPDDLVTTEKREEKGKDRKKAINLFVEASKKFEKEELEAMRKEGKSILRKIGQER